MQRLTYLPIIFALLCPSIFAEDAKPAEEKKEEKITFVDHVLPIFRARCGSCHNANDRRGGLVLDQYGLMMEGGSSGSVIEAGDASFSYLYMLVTHEETPKMPPNAEKIPADEIAMIKKWIDLGALENAGSKANIKKKASLAKIDVSGERPAEVAMPTAYLGDPVHMPSGRNAVTALATSPWASLAAVSGYQQISVYNTKTMEMLGVLPFPEGQPQIIKFSRNGDLLMVGGGRGGASGKVVVYDVRTGERKIEVGAEYDSILAADISPDQSIIALGGPKKMLRCYSTATGELLYENKKHTDWITSIEFSPDGVLLASGDRSNGLVIWEALTGRLFYDLAGHKGAVTDVSWRPDSNVLASASEDGTIKLWEMHNGGNIKSWNAHGGGVAAMDYTREGNLVSTGRDKVTRYWNGDGGKLRDLPALADIGMEVAFDNETKRVLAGDWTGMISVWNAEDGAVLGTIDTNPPKLATQIKELEGLLASAANEVSQADAKLKAVQQKLVPRKEAAEKAKAAFAQASEKAKVATAAKQKAEQDRNASKAAVDTATTAVQQTQAQVNQAKQQLADATNKVNAAKGPVEAAKPGLDAAQLLSKASNDSAAKARTLADAAQAVANPTDEEKQLLATDPAIKKAIDDRVAVAKQARVAADAATQKAQQEAQKLAGVQNDYNAKVAALQQAEAAMKAAQQQVTQFEATLAKANQTLALANEQLKKMQVALDAAVNAEKAEAAAVVAAKAAMDKAVAAAQPNDAEKNELQAAEAALKAAQEKHAGIDQRMKRLQATQSQLATR